VRMKRNCAFTPKRNLESEKTIASRYESISALLAFSRLIKESNNNCVFLPINKRNVMLDPKR